MYDANVAREAVEKHKPAAVRLSDELALNPETACEERESSRRMTELLSKAGFKIEQPYCGFETAFRALLDNGDGPSVAVLAEYDALPEIGHGCGHNLHGAMSVLTGLALAELTESFKGKLYIVGTPAEESLGAKAPMADAGIFDGMDLAMMVHCFSGPAAEPAMRCLALKCYKFTFRGQTAHAAACPWEGRNALTAARKFLDLIDGRRELYMPDVRASFTILDGGKRPNIIPDRSSVLVEFRAENFSKLETVTDSILKCANGAAMAFDCEVEWERDCYDFADLVENRAAEGAIYEILEGLGVALRPCSPPMGSSDIGNISYRCPAIHPILPIADEPINFHTAEFAQATQRPRAYEALATGAEAMTLMALRVFNDADLRKSIREEFERRTKK